MTPDPTCFENMAVNAVLREFDSNLPRFEVSSSNIDIIASPNDFHNILLSKISNSKRRIVLSSLYIASDAQLLVRVFIVDQVLLKIFHGLHDLKYSDMPFGSP